jgi:outer membrane protein OmpA-like peptidoglycan-associated protein
MRISGLAGQGENRHAGIRRSLVGRVLCVALPLFLGACSAVPDWADPTDWFAADVPPTVVAQGQAQAAGSDSFPTLGSVPNAKPQASSPATRAAVRATLAADQANADYSGQRLVAETGAEVSKMPLGAGGVLPTAAGAPMADQTGASAGQAPVSKAPAKPSASMTEAAPPPEPAKSTYRFTQFDKPSATQSAAMSTPSPAPARNSVLVAVIYFAYGSVNLNENDRAVLHDVATLQRQSGGTVRVIGHASARTGIYDPTRHRLANLETSLNRANAVVAQLVRMGVDKNKIAAEAKSDSQPVFHEFMPTGEAGNRRAEIFLEN